MHLFVQAMDLSRSIHVGCVHKNVGSLHDSTMKMMLTKSSVPVEVGSTFQTQLLKNKTSFNMYHICDVTGLHVLKFQQYVLSWSSSNYICTQPVRSGIKNSAVKNLFFTGGRKTPHPRLFHFDGRKLRGVEVDSD